jgi:hypothetical protein
MGREGEGKEHQIRASQEPPLSCILLIKSSFSQENSKKNKARESSSCWRGRKKIQRNQLFTSLHKTAKKEILCTSSFPP